MKANSTHYFRCSLAVIAVSLALMSVASRGSAQESAGVALTSTMPRIKSMKGGYYPDKAKRLGLEGRALVEFNIDADGQSKQLSIVFADDATFAHMATTIISGARFDVPTDWVASGHEEQRYRLGLVFCLPPSSQMDTFTETTDTVVIKGSRIPGSPIRHPPSPGTAGKCMQT